MIWPFRPHPPLPLAHKVACERHFAVVGRLLGGRRIFSGPVVAPQDIDALIADCEMNVLPQRLFSFMAARMPVCDRVIDVGWAEADDLTVNDQATHYNTATDGEGLVTAISFHPLLQEYPYRLAAVTATAAAEYLIRSESLSRRIAAGAFEILPLFFGFGPIVANAALHEIAESTGLIWKWEMSRAGIVSPLEFGYCMALADWALDTSHVDIKPLLRLDAREGLEKGLRFLEKTGDCCFEQDFLDRAPDQSVGFMLSRLNHRSNSVQLSTLMDLYASDSVDPDLVVAVADLLRHSEEDIQRLAAATLERCETLPPQIHDELLIVAESGSTALRRAAVAALRPGFDNDGSVLEILTDVLGRGDATTAAACVRTALKYESYPEHMFDSLSKALAGMVLTSGTEDLMLGVALLRRLHDNPSKVLQTQFEDDPTALAIFDELLNPPVETNDAATD